jgi:nucleoid-associated protein YgaU
LKRQNVLKVLFFSLILSSFASSCGLIEKWKTPEQPTDSNAPVETASTESPAEKSTEVDDLFSKTMSDTNPETDANTGTDAPVNIDAELAAAPKEDSKEDLKSLENEFSGTPEKIEAQTQVKVEEALPEIKEELQPAITDNTNFNAGKIESYKVKKGETLMQIAFKVYGDVSKWKAIQQMNDTQLSNNALIAGMDIKYKAPAKNFVWNPEGTPHLIKTGETLGTISNDVYQTPKKWKDIWENNKPLIKNPNIIFAGFTLYTKNAGMANYVQPKAVQKKAALVNEVQEQERAIAEIEEVKIDQSSPSMELTPAHEAEIDLTQEVQSAPSRDVSDIKEEVKSDELQDAAIIK